jgi:EAL domain-containing protein (putative c-di-GMP-specific phosphodiesterase class I)
VETEKQLLILREVHCDYIQGFFYSKPLSFQNFEKLLLPIAIESDVESERLVLNKL